MPFTRPESFLGGWLSFFVVRTDILADVTAEYVITGQGAHLPRHASLDFDGQVGNTTPAIQQVGAHQGPRGAGLDAQIALSAPISDRPVTFKLEAEKKFAEEKPGPSAGMDERGVFSDPSDSGQRAEFPLEHRSGIHIRPSLDRLPHFGSDLCQKLCQAGFQNFVVVIPPGVARDPTPLPVLRSIFSVKWDVVVQRHRHNGFRPGEKVPGMEALLCPPLEIGHLSGEALPQPFRKGCAMGRWDDR